MKAKVWVAFAAEALVLAVLLFGAAGTLRWPAGWAFIGLFFGGTLPMGWMLARHDPALLDERMRLPIQKDQPLWDRIILSVFFILFPGWLVLMGLDAVRFGWSVMPVWLQWVGGAGLALSFWIMHLTFRENTFLAPVVKIQTERGHKVVSTGPYAVVRHPLYAAALMFFAATALMLGSWYGLAAALVLAGVLVVRTAMEERELRCRLDGYAAYARRVRYRLVPWIW
ncbi:MAG: methyltransferase family protein [Geminicoccaceae bacterium]